MTTARTILNDAFEEIGVYPTSGGENLPNYLAQSGLRRMNRWIDSISNKDLYIYQQKEESLALTSGQASYTIGSGGDFDTVRPQKILDSAFIRNTAGTYDYPVKLISMSAYRRLRDKSVSTRPIFMAYNPTFPLGTIYLFRTPDSARNLHLISLKQLNSFSDLDTDLTFPPGYERFMVTNVAITLASSRGRSVSPELASDARDAEENVKSRNAQQIEPIRLTELSQLSGHRSDFNILEGPYV